MEQIGFLLRPAPNLLRLPHFVWSRLEQIGADWSRMGQIGFLLRLAPNLLCLPHFFWSKLKQIGAD
jgi:hypothetical protein